MNILQTAVVLVRPKYPENVGSVARACMNMGCRRIILVNPRNWDVAKARILATPHSEALLENITIAQDLAEALAPFSVVYGTTARTGGWRKSIITPEKAGDAVAEHLTMGEDIALVFGPEDTGLDNGEIEICGQLICIPTHRDMTSLNLAQAVLIILYEIFKHSLITPPAPRDFPPTRSITHKEQEVLIQRIKTSLMAIDFLHDDNPDYFMLPMRRFLQRFAMKRHEFNLLMGICRQIEWMTTKGQTADPTEDTEHTG